MVLNSLPHTTGPSMRRVTAQKGALRHVEVKVVAVGKQLYRLVGVLERITLGAIEVAHEDPGDVWMLPDETLTRVQEAAAGQRVVDVEEAGIVPQFSDRPIGFQPGPVLDAASRQRDTTVGAL